MQFDQEDGVHTLHLAQDLSQLQEVESSLRESRELYQDLYEDSPDMMVSVDPETARVVQCNKAVCRILEYEKDQVLGRSIFDFYHPDCQKTVQEALEKFRDKGELVDVELTLVTRSGRPIEVLLNSSAARAADGRILRSRSVWRDITKHAQALRELSRTTGRLNFVLSSTGVGLWLNSFPLHELEWDARTKELFFVAENERPTLELFRNRLHPEDVERTLLAMEQAIENRDVYNIEHRVIDPKSGEVFWLRSMGMATYSEDGVPLRFDGLNYDITEQKRGEEKLRLLASQLSDADRRKDEFLATLAHELRNPLAPISMGLQVLKNLDHDPEKWAAVRETMERQTNQLVVLVDDLLDVSRITRGKLVLRNRFVKLNEVLLPAIEAVRPSLLEKGHELVVPETDDSLLIWADPHRMTQVFTNLLSNAVKYTPSRGRIEIAVDDDSKEVRVSVKDSGNGIPTAHLDGIFGLFSQLDTGKERLKSGLGIGLTLVRSLVEMHGGTVRAESDGEGLGSVFTVTIPLTSASSEDGEMAPKQEASHELRGCRVLVVDDNKAISKMLEMSMTLLGNEVRVAGDGQEAFQIASQFLPQLILMDIGMPRMNGLEAAKLIKQQEWGRSMTLVALSGWGQERDRRQAFEAGFDHHLVKPAKQSDLKRILIEVASKSK